MTKDVINDEDGIKLGKIVDIDFDIKTGNVETIVVNKGFRFNNFLNSKEASIIPWEKVLKIGNDVIIVESKIHKKDKIK